MSAVLDKELYDGWVKIVDLTLHPLLTPSNEVRKVKTHMQLSTYLYTEHH